MNWVNSLQKEGCLHSLPCVARDGGRGESDGLADLAAGSVHRPLPFFHSLGSRTLRAILAEWPRGSTRGAKGERLGAVGKAQDALPSSVVTAAAALLTAARWALGRLRRKKNDGKTS